MSPPIKPMIYKNDANELWCECGNRIHLQGFYLLDNKGQFVDGDGSDFEFLKKIGAHWTCDRCNETCDFELNKVPTKNEPENHMQNG